MELDLSRRDEPEPHQGLRALLEDWLAYERQSLRRKLRDLGPAGATAHAVPPVELSVIGLIRHMTDVEHMYLTWGLGGGEQDVVHGDDDFAGGSPARMRPTSPATSQRSSAPIPRSPRWRTSTTPGSATPGRWAPRSSR